MKKTFLHDSDASTDVTSIAETPIHHPTSLASFWVERLPYGIKISCNSKFTISMLDTGEILIEGRSADDESIPVCPSEPVSLDDDT